MKRVQLVFASLLSLLILACTAHQAMAACTATGFTRDGINLTAALINPVKTVSGDVDATGCNIGVYYGPGVTGLLNAASIHNANYYGVVNNGATVSIQNSTIYDIGESPFNGSQHGVAIYFAYNTKAVGNIFGNVIWNYQKAGIVINGPHAKSNVQNNTVIGQGPINFIAQNGIEFGFGSQGSIIGNLVVGNSYTGANLASSGGILLFGGDGYGGPVETGITIQTNVVVGNDVGVWLSNLDVNYNPVLTPTKDLVLGNTVRNNAINNTTGDGATAGYQAGIADQGDLDVIQGNSICGTGYTPLLNPPPYLFMIDTTATNNPVLKSNTTCNASSPVTSTVIHNKMRGNPHI